MTLDTFVNKQHLYHSKVLNDQDYIDNDQTKTDDAQFININNFETLDIDNSPYSIGKDISKQLKKEINNFSNVM